MKPAGLYILDVDTTSALAGMRKAAQLAELKGGMTRGQLLTLRATVTAVLADGGIVLEALKIALDEAAQ